MADKLDMFQLLGVPRKFRVDQKALDEGYRRVELQVHPDRFASATPAMKRVAEQWSQRANEALSTLSDPLKRAVYLCESAGLPRERREQHPHASRLPHAADGVARKV